MTNEEYLNKIREHGVELRKDPVKLLEFMKSIGAFKKRRVIEGEEREQVLTMLRLLGPGTSSDNQHVWTESWRVGNVEYNIHSNDKFEELEEVIDDEPSH